MADQFQEMRYSVGVHPLDVHHWGPDTANVLKNAALDDSRVVAIGELGLDLFKAENLSEQLSILMPQLNLAFELKLPVIVHCRDAAKEEDRARRAPGHARAAEGCQASAGECAAARAHPASLESHIAARQRRWRASAHLHTSRVRRRDERIEVLSQLEGGARAKPQACAAGGRAVRRAAAVRVGARERVRVVGHGLSGVSGRGPSRLGPARARVDVGGTGYQHLTPYSQPVVESSFLQP